jgi:rSAM/selenodomain-associated transferase 2
MALTIRDRLGVSADMMLRSFRTLFRTAWAAGDVWDDDIPSRSVARAEQLRRYDRQHGNLLNDMKIPSGRVSIVVPTLNEADRLPHLLMVLASELNLREIIVADGGSDDRTQLVALQLGAKVISTERGRGHALREGAVVASGDILLFLHADSIFPPGGLAAIVSALDRDQRVVGGNFRVGFDVDTPFTRRLAAVYGWIRPFPLYYGDSGIFVRRKVYDEIGGIKPMPLMEDYDFVRRLERAGRTCRIDDPPLITSSRRFIDRPWPVALWGFTKIHLFYWLGASPEHLASIYARDQERWLRRASMRRQS